MKRCCLRATSSACAPSAPCWSSAAGTRILQARPVTNFWRTWLRCPTRNDLFLSFEETLMTTENKEPKKVIPIAVAAPDEELVSLYAAHQKIYPRSVSGVFTQWRWIMVWVTQIIFYGLPWIEWGQRQAVLFDLSVRRFYIFGLVLYPQDFIYLTGLMIIAALSLFLFTAVAGRLWCGYACPQTVYTEIFLWIEKLLEGDRSGRVRHDEGPMNAEKFGRKG